MLHLKTGPLKSDLQKVRISNVFGFQMVGFQIPTVFRDIEGEGVILVVVIVIVVIVYLINLNYIFGIHV